MRIENVKDPMAVAKLYPWFVPTPEQDRMEMACELAQRLTDKPDDTLCLVAVERDIARAVLIAHVAEQRKRSVWLFQANSELGFKHSHTMFEALKSWAKDKGAKEIRMGAVKHQKAFERRWGFVPCGTDEMRLKIR